MLRHKQSHPLGRAQQQANIQSERDDWTGITDRLQRRRLQNRLNQRTQREKRKALREAYRQEASNRQLNRQPVNILPRPAQTETTSASQTVLFDKLIMMSHFEKIAYKSYASRNPCADHLMTLSRFNVLRAFMNNSHAMGLSPRDVGAEDAISPFFHQPQRPQDQIIPKSLQPTRLQCSTPHHPWLDAFPFPQIRDNLISTLTESDDCSLCVDIMDPDGNDLSVLVWGEPSDPRNWEITAWFMRRWAWVVHDCPEIICSSNYWRRQRQLESLPVEIDREVLPREHDEKMSW